MKETLEILNALRILVQSLRVSSRAAEKTTGLSGAQLFVLEKLEESPELSLNELAERTHTHQSSVSVVVSRLIEKKLITSKRDVGDGRKLILSLTKQGKDKLKGAPLTAQDCMISGIEKMKKQDREELARLLGLFLDKSGFAGDIPALFFEDSKKDLKKVQAANAGAARTTTKRKPAQ